MNARTEPPTRRHALFTLSACLSGAMLALALA